jgi:hypothetical protein
VSIGPEPLFLPFVERLTNLVPRSSCRELPRLPPATATPSSTENLHRATVPMPLPVISRLGEHPSRPTCPARPRCRPGAGATCVQLFLDGFAASKLTATAAEHTRRACSCRTWLRQALEPLNSCSLAQPSYVSFGCGPSRAASRADVRDLGRSRPNGGLNLFLFPNRFEWIQICSVGSKIHRKMN